MKNEYKIIIVAGPTASGKTSFSIKLAQALEGEIINADSLQIYSEIPILSAQPTSYEKQNIPHHLFGYIKGDEEYTVSRWIDDASACIKNSKKQSILVGGTGFYLKHLIFGLSPIPDIPEDIRLQARQLLEETGAIEFHSILNQIDPRTASLIEQNNAKRALRAYEVIKATGKSISCWQGQNIGYFPISSFKLIILAPNRELLYKNCNQRFLDMLDLGAIEEVKQLLKKQYPPLSSVLKSHGTPELTKYLSGEWSLEQAIVKSQQVVRNYAKRQTTWFKHQFNHPELDVCFVENSIEEFEIIARECKKFLGS